MSGSPWFNPFRILVLRRDKFVLRLDHKIDLDSVFSFRSKLFSDNIQNLFPDNEYNFSKTRADSVKKGIVHDGFSTRAKTVNLFDPSIPAPDSCSQNQ